MLNLKQFGAALIGRSSRDRWGVSRPPSGKTGQPFDAHATADYLNADAMRRDITSEAAGRARDAEAGRIEGDIDARMAAWHRSQQGN